MIYSQVGYDPTGKHRFEKWHERIALNHKSAPSGFFHVFNEAHTIIYELIIAGANVGDEFVVDISIGQHWSKHWTDSNLQLKFGDRAKYPHHYPESHPQSKSNPQESWCYPLAALGYYREWLENTYIGAGKFAGYLDRKVSQKAIAPSVAQLALKSLSPQQLSAQQD